MEKDVKIIFFEELNNLDNYPISNLKIDEILKQDKNYIGTYSKDNVPLLKNNQSTIINLQDSDKNVVIGLVIVKETIKYFILIAMVWHT